MEFRNLMSIGVAEIMWGSCGGHVESSYACSVKPELAKSVPASAAMDDAVEWMAEVVGLVWTWRLVRGPAAPNGQCALGAEFLLDDAR